MADRHLTWDHLSRLCKKATVGTENRATGRKMHLVWDQILMQSACSFTRTEYMNPSIPDRFIIDSEGPKKRIFI